MPREKKITCGWRKVSIFTLILIIFGLYGPTVYFSSINMSKNRATIIRKSATEVEMDQEVPLLQKSKTNYFVESDIGIKKDVTQVPSLRKSKRNYFIESDIDVDGEEEEEEEQEDEKGNIQDNTNIVNNDIDEKEKEEQNNDNNEHNNDDNLEKNKSDNNMKTMVEREESDASEDTPESNISPEKEKDKKTIENSNNNNTGNNRNFSSGKRGNEQLLKTDGNKIDSDHEADKNNDSMNNTRERNNNMGKLPYVETVSLKDITKEKKQNLSQSIQYAEGKNRIDNNSIITISSFKEKNNTENNKINQSFSQPISIENASSGSIKKDYKKILNFFTNSSRNESTVLNKYEKKTMEKKCKLVANPKDVQRRNFCGGKIPVIFWDFLNPDICRKIYEGDTQLKQNLIIEMGKDRLYKYQSPNGQHHESKRIVGEAYELDLEKINTSPIRLQYETFFDVEQGFQDNSGGMIDNSIITTGGFCGGEYLDHWLEPYCCGVRGFLKTTRSFGMDTIDAWDASHKDLKQGTKQCQNSARPKGKWKSLPDWPGTPRQGHACVSVEKEFSMYCWGGYSYTPAKNDLGLFELRKTKKAAPYGYRDGYKLVKNKAMPEGKQWAWSPLPKIPSHQGALTAMCYDTVSNSIYLVGGADYDLKQFSTVSDRRGKKEFVGRFAWKFSVIQQKWLKLPDLPGSGRMTHGVACVNGKVYVLGGASGGTSLVGGATTFRTVIDNWVLDVKTVQWKRIVDTPLVMGNFCRATVYKDRYIFLMGGAGYGKVYDEEIKSFWNDGKNKPDVMKFPTDPSNFRREYSNNVFVYDTKLDKFYHSDLLPINNNCPMVYIHKDYIYLLGGEGGSGCAFGQVYGQHLTMFLRARITISPEHET